MSTIREVAAKANVSPATVSRVLTNSSNTSEDVRKRVIEAVNELGYSFSRKKNSSNQSLKNICLFMSIDSKEVFSSPFYNDLIWGAYKQAESEEVSLQITIVNKSQDTLNQLRRMVTEKNVDGFILCSLTEVMKKQVANLLNELGTPFVLIGNTFNSNIFSIHNDNIQMSYMTTQYLINQGYQRILFLIANMELGGTDNRVIGYKECIKDYQLPFSDEYIVNCETEHRSILSTLNTLTSKGITFDAIIASDSIMAVSVLTYCKENSINVPNDVGIIGFNDSVFLDRISPSISGVQISTQAIAQESVITLVELLVNKEKNHVMKNILFPAEIIERDSTRKGGD